MKYLLSKLLSTEDTEKFMRDHEGEFMDEYSLDFYIQRATRTLCRKIFMDLRFNLDKRSLSYGIAQGLFAGIDAIVCYPDDAEEYGRFGKKIITVERSEA